jgi:hypothetical protein
MLSVVMLNVANNPLMLCIITLSGVTLNVVMLSVVAPLTTGQWENMSIII